MPINQGLMLDRYLEKRPRLEPLKAARIVLAVAEQLGASTNPFLIHPGRIFCSREGGVQLLPPPDREGSLPAIIEHADYASPEEIRGAQPDERSGLYSLGCTLHQLIAGQPPYPRTDAKEVLQAHLESPAPDVRGMAPHVPTALAALVSELLAKDPELRVQTSSELVRRLKKCIQEVQASGALASPHPPPKTSRPAMPPLLAVNPVPNSDPKAPQLPTRSPSAIPASKHQRSGGSAQGARPGAQLRGTTPGKQRTGNPGKSGDRSRWRPSQLPVPSRPGASPGRGHKAAAEDPLIQEVPPGPYLKKKKAYPFTISGAILGFVLGLIAVQQTGERKAVERKKETERMELEQTQALVDRKKRHLAADEELRKKVTDFLDLRLKGRSTSDQQVMLEGNIAKFAQDNPYTHLLLDAYLKVWTPAGTGSAAENEEEGDKAYTLQKAEAEKLHAEGKIGLAYRRIHADYNRNKSRHGKEIDEIMARWEKEIVEKGEGALAEAQRHGKDGDSEKALEALRKGLEVVEGDEKLTQSIREQINRVNEAVALHAANAQKATKSLAEESPSTDTADPEKALEDDKPPENTPEPEGDAPKGGTTDDVEKTDGTDDADGK